MIHDIILRNFCNKKFALFFESRTHPQIILICKYICECYLVPQYKTQALQTGTVGFIILLYICKRYMYIISIYTIYRVFTGNCGKIIGNNTDIYQVISLLYHLYCLMLDISGKNIHNKQLTTKFFPEGNVVEEKPNSSISLPIPTPFQS